MKMSRAERKAYKQGRRDGYLDGYTKGLYDGNPFNKIVEAISDMVNTITADPELMAEVLKQQGKNPAELDAEYLTDEEIQDAMQRTYLGGKNNEDIE